MDFEEELVQRLGSLERRGILRSRSNAILEGLVDFCSNDYLGYGRGTVSRETIQAGAGASRLIFGTHSTHVELESVLAAWVGREAALLFSSGYVANLSALYALAAPEDLIISDELNHASIIDGCRLARARVRIVPHRSLGAVREALETPTKGRRWVVTESYFSMDADSPNLAELRLVCDRYDAALYVDEAHALGVFGPSGSGLCRAAGVTPDVLVGTLGKAVGVAGAFVAGSHALADFLWNRARGFVFSTAVSPVLARTALQNVRRLVDDDAARSSLAALAEHFGDLLPEARRPDRHGPIFPIRCGSPERAVRAAELLRGQGFLVQAIRPPTVKESRLRVALHADTREEDVTRLAKALSELCGAS